MRSVHDSVETVNAAATAIVAAEARVQPSTVQKRRWAGWWSLYWCFGSFKHDKRISHHALLMSETTGGVSSGVPATCYVENSNQNSTVTLPFIAPPSSPAAYLPSHSPSTSNSPSALLSLSSLSVHSCSPGMTAHIFLIGPYADETQLVSPPAFSAFTTQPSTASFTPPPEPLHMTTPPSPEVPFAQLLASSLAQKRRNFSQYDFQSSGTSSPFFDRRASIELLRLMEAPKYVGYEHFMNYTWGSRVGSRLGSGALTPSSALSRLGSGTLTPINSEPAPPPLENQISEVVEMESNDVVDHRVSFELSSEYIPTCIVKDTIPSHKIGSETLREAAQGSRGKDLAAEVAHSFRRDLDGNSEEWHHKNRSISFGSSIEFDFNNSRELGSQKNWSFFPMIQSGVS